MHKLLARSAALALSGIALAACASADQPATPAQTQTTDTSLPVDVNNGVRQAQQQRVQGDLSGAIHTLSQLMLVSPDDPRVIGEYGKTLAQQGRATEAIAFLNRAVELQPNDWTLYSALGVADDQKGDSNAARLAYQHALKLQPGEPVVLNNLAMSRVLAGDLSGAHDLLSQAAAKDATNSKIASNLAMVDRLEKDRPQTAVAENAKPAADKPAVAVEPLHKARTAPARLAAAKPDHPRVIMQAVPVDPLAGPVSRHREIAKAPPRKLAAPHKSKVETAKNAIPALRLANDQP
ncbi:MAG: tetratricopeptide repeat protein [Alphaproteobacteria bacterium]|nr:tetratricopeptide repeat protein [Alphaproteobacteria bacterium]MDE2112962.1 tetratricopeptide repeat protein [Alphaproteobacteria bacterium]MDE2493315.1 tetratricopeptide repeat protein [Alphaproteobacteria bacterium]